VNDTFLSVRGLSKRFGGHAAVHDVSFTLRRGEMLALLGPSGSGKTTTLRLLGGFEEPDAGQVVVDGADVTRLPPADRGFGVVFQHYALFPHLDVGENVGFGLESRSVPGAERAAQVGEGLSLVDLGGFERRRVHELSGGQQQRVALARALVLRPRLLLLDEPLSNLDPALRERTRRELRQLIRRTATTTLLVTHEQEDAFDLADRVAVLERGSVAQVGTPDELYHRPANAFVARFIGRSVELKGEVTARGSLRVAGAELPVPGAAGPGPVTVVARPESFRPASGDEPAIDAAVLERRFAGAASLFVLETPGGESLEVLADAGWAPGDRLRLAPSGRGLYVFPRNGA
jgi:putative spermidine/putrescine transport system ATP-binding protein